MLLKLCSPKENKFKDFFSPVKSKKFLCKFIFGAGFIKCDITGDVREIKIKRPIEIEKSLK